MSGKKRAHAASARPKESQRPFPDQPFPRQTQLFLLLMFAGIALRLWLLIVSRHYLRSDEAVTAMEALDILEGGPIPFFYYGQLYGGGHTVEALMAVPLFAVFGPSDYLFKLGPALLSAVYIAAVYLCLYEFFNKRYALIAALLFSFFVTFVAFNFHDNGGMETTFFGWLGLYFFFRSYFAEEESPWCLFLSGASIGFAYYCFDYALYYLFAVTALWILKENIRLWRRWPSMLSLLAGFTVGASPLIYYNLTHDFANIKFIWSQAAQPDATPVLSALVRFARLVYHDLPAFFSLDVDAFPPEISPISYLLYGLFLFSVIYVLVKMRPAILALARSFFAGRTATLPSEERIVYFLLLMLLWGGIYALASARGSRPRYLIVLCPFIPSVIAWAAYDMGRRFLLPATIFIALFGALQIPFMVDFAKDKTVPEWDVQTHGEDMRTLAKFLLDNHLTTVATPYDIKWKLMFESRRRVVCASYLFGFDREEKYNREVIDRVNRRGMPLAFVFDKEYKLPKVALRFNPRGAFDVDGFREFLRENQIDYRVTPVGQDYVVYHEFSKPFPLPDPYSS